MPPEPLQYTSTTTGGTLDVWLPARYCGFLGDAASEEPAGGWYGFGWGDREFFLNTPYAADVKPGILFKALFLPSRSVLAVQYSSKPAPFRFVRDGKDLIEPERGCAAAGYIAGWFLRSGTAGLLAGSENAVHPSYTGYRFYESRGRYSLFFTSNNWTAAVLKAAGLPSGLWTPLTFGVLR